MLRQFTVVLLLIFYFASVINTFVPCSSPFSNKMEDKFLIYTKSSASVVFTNLFMYKRL